MHPDSADATARAIGELLDVMDRLRRECAWTSAQTHTSLARYVTEEADEVVEAIESGELGQLRDELGDLLLQVIFHAQIAREAPNGWDFADIARVLTTKLKRRNPHVFGDSTASTIEEIDAQWRRIKAEEKRAD